MNLIEHAKIQDYINDELRIIQQHRVDAIQELKLENLLAVDSYLFTLRDEYFAGDIVSKLLKQYIANIEDNLNEDFFKNLAVFVSEMICGGQKSAKPGIDLELIKNGDYYLITIKLKPSRLNVKQLYKLELEFKNAQTTLNHSKSGKKLFSVLGICFGKPRVSSQKGYTIYTGKDFWHFISNYDGLYTDLVEPIDARVRIKDQLYHQEKSNAENRLTSQFIDRFCDQDFRIDWVKLVEFNSGNFDLDRFLP